MKNIPLFLIFISCFCVTSLEAKQPETRGLYVSLIQDPPTLCNPKEILNLVNFAKKHHVQTLFIQVYRANEAWFPSRFAQMDDYQSCLKNSSQDPLKLLIREAHRQKIEVHAWLNLLSLGANANAPMLKRHGVGILTTNRQEKQSIEEYKVDGQYFLEPSDRRVRHDLSEIVKELLKAYPTLDGIQFDYIRYPDVNPDYGYNLDNVLNFKKKTGVRIINAKDPRWRQWKRDQVTRLLKELVLKVRQMRPTIKISTTGCLPFIRADEEAFQDWVAWVNQGVVDFVTLMNYPPEMIEFEKNIQEAQQKTKNSKRISMALGAYKFIDSPQGFINQLQFCEKSTENMCVIFHYGNLLDKPELAQALIQESSQQIK